MPVDQKLHDSLEEAQGNASDMFDKMDGAVDMLGKVRGEMDKLMGMGDQVTQKDVIESAGKIVGFGVAPLAMAKMLAGDPEGTMGPMPQNGQALQGWVANIDKDMVQREKQAEQAHQLLGHHLANSSFRLLAAKSLGAEAPSPSAQMNGPTGPSPQEASGASMGNPLTSSVH